MFGWKNPSIAKVYEAIAGSRRMGSEGTVENYVRAIRMFVDFLGLENPEETLQQFLEGELEAASGVLVSLQCEIEDGFSE